MMQILSILLHFYWIILVAKSDVVLSSTVNVGIIFDFKLGTTYAKIFDFEVNGNIINSPVNFTSIKDCQFSIDKDSKLDTIKTKFENCVKIASDSLGNNFDAKITWPILTSTQYLDHLKIKDTSTTVSKIMEELDSILKSKGFSKAYPNSYYQKILPDDEVVFEHLATGYTEGTDKFKFVSTLEVGDFSLKVSHPYSDKNVLSPLFATMEIKVFGKSQKVSVTNILCADSKNNEDLYHINMAINDDSHDRTLLSPCYPNGYTFEIDTDSITHSCTDHLKHDKKKLEKKYTVRGQSDSDVCFTHLTEVFCSNKSFKDKPCPLKDDQNNEDINTLLPEKGNLNIKLIGAFVELKNKYPSNDLNELYNKIEHECLGQQVDQNPFKHCFNDMYLYFILRKFSGKNIKLEFGTNKHDWTLGKMLNETISIKDVIAEARKKIIIIAVTVPIVIIVAICSIAAIYWITKN